MKDKVEMIYDSLMDFRDECREEFKEIKANAKAHAEEMHEHKEDVEGRLDKLEAPGKALKQIKIKLLLYI